MYQMAWVRGGFRPIYDQRKIKRGRNKGKVEVVYRANGNRMRKTIIPESNIKLGEDFNHDLRGKKKRI